MSIASEITRLQGAKADIKTAIEAKGVTIPSNATLDKYSDYVEEIPSGGTDTRWQEIGYEGEPKSIQDGIDHAKEIYDNWDANNTARKLNNDTNLVFCPIVDTSQYTDISNFFTADYSLLEIPLLNLSNVTKISSFANSCKALKYVPVLNLSKAQSMNSMFTDCNNLTDEALDNILVTCINATYITTYGSATVKKLSWIGISSSYWYPVTRLEALPHYQDFINAGWTIGY